MARVVTRLAEALMDSVLADMITSYESKQLRLILTQEPRCPSEKSSIKSGLHSG
jgi:hypothetical protein